MMGLEPLDIPTETEESCDLEDEGEIVFCHSQYPMGIDEFFERCDLLKKSGLNMKEKVLHLIELVAVVVLLGTLAITAAPKFLNRQADAINATLEGMKDAINRSTGITTTRLLSLILEGDSNHGDHTHLTVRFHK